MCEEKISSWDEIWEDTRMEKPTIKEQIMKSKKVSESIAIETIDDVRNFVQALFYNTIINSDKLNKIMIDALAEVLEVNKDDLKLYLSIVID